MPASLKKLALIRLNRPNSQSSALLKQGRFLTPHSLIFWLTGQGRMCAEVLLFDFAWGAGTTALDGILTTLSANQSEFVNSSV